MLYNIHNATYYTLYTGKMVKKAEILIYMLGWLEKLFNDLILNLVIF